MATSMKAKAVGTIHALRRGLGPVLFGLCLWAPAAVAQGLTGSTTICGQSVSYTMTPPALDMSSELRALSGIWVGNATFPVPISGVAEVTQCRGLIIESIAADGVVRSKHIWGDQIRFIANGANIAIKPGISNWKGKLTGNVVRFDSPTGYVFELHLTTANEMRGAYLTPDGKGAAQFQRQ